MGLVWEIQLCYFSLAFKSISNHSIFYRHSNSGKCILLIVYVDDIVITGNNKDGITTLKDYLYQQFQTNDLKSYDTLVLRLLGLVRE